MRHHKVSSPFITIAIVNHSGINMSYVLVTKFAMLPGLVVQSTDAPGLCDGLIWPKTGYASIV